MVFTLPIFAQVKNERIKDSYLLAKYKIGGAVEKLKDDQTYKLIFPTELNYNKGKENDYRWDNLSLSMDAKKAKGDVQPYRTFEIVTKGLTPLNKFEDIQMSMPANPAIKGWVRKVYFSFPIKVVVKDDKGNTEKELVLYDEASQLSGIYHTDMIVEDPNLRGGERPVIPFATKDRLQQAYDANKIAVEKRLERNEVLKFYPQIARAIYAGYDYNKFSKSTIGIYTITKKDKEKYTSFAETSEKLEQGLNSMEDDTKSGEAYDILKNCYLFYKEQLAQKNNLPTDIVKLCDYNGSIAALMTGNISDANFWFSDYYTNCANLGPFGDAVNIDVFNKLYAAFTPFYCIKQATGKQAYLNSPITAYDDKSKADDLAIKEKAKSDSIAQIEADIKDPNIKGKQGYVVLTNGEKIEGLIYVTFVEASSNSGMIDLDKGQRVTVGVIVNGAESKNTYKPKDVSYFFAREQRYEPLNVKEGAVLGLLGKATGNFSRYNFYKLIYQAGKYIIYQDPVSTSFYAIKKSGDENAYYVRHIER